MTCPPPTHKRHRCDCWRPLNSQAHWFFGNLYEAVVRIPDRLADEPDSARRVGRSGVRTVLQRGSPVRYHLPAAPVALGAPIGALLAGWDDAGSRRWLATCVVSTFSGGLLTRYLVRRINLPLFFAARPLPAIERQELLRQWYMLNRLRLAASGVSLLSAHRARAACRAG
jgi:hypothetical protein